MRTTLLPILLFSLTTLSLFSQNPYDCVSAMEICTKENIVVSYETQAGEVVEEIDSICTFPPSFFNSESNPGWYKYSFVTSGDFTFNIIPKNENTDIDFVVFQSDLNTCEALKSIRCMFTGENVGQPNSDLCLGATGLSATSTDLAEAPGCQDGDDNYLAPLNVEEGDVIFLFISDFGGSGFQEYTIEHGGSANLPCEPVSTNKINPISNIKLYPNPFSNIINFEALDQSRVSGSIKVLSLSGTEMASFDAGEIQELNLSFLESGIYFLSYVNSKGVSVFEKIIKQ